MSLSVLICVTHLLGVGHLARAAAIGRALARRGHRVTLASGGMPAPLVPVTGLRLVQLPPVRTAPGDFRTLLDDRGQFAGAEVMAARRQALRAEVEREPPDILVTELFPFGRRGLAEEFVATIEAVRSLRPRAVVASSIRDILVAPDRPAKIVEAHARLARLYDAILVHGDPGLVPLTASWPLDPALHERLHYTGYVDSAADAGSPAPARTRSGIVVSGGGSAAGLPLFEAALDAADLVRDQRWSVLVGAGIDDTTFAALQARAPAHVAVERARSAFRDTLAKAALSVSQAGYNTLVDVLGAGTRAVLVPFEKGAETEQRQRATLFAAGGRAVVLAEDDLSGQSLAAAIRTALAAPAPSSMPLRLDGADESAHVLERLAARTEAPARPALAAPVAGGWAHVSQALDRAADRGLRLRFWWRDDDAVAATPQLDRLIALARGCGCPLAVAAIPALAQPSLAERVADEALVRILVHGWSHRDHAATGAKKAEFGPDRSAAEACRDMAAALAAARALFGQCLVPVFVPPWNRIAPALAAELSGLGYGALSTFRSKPDPGRPATIRRIDTHLDPIAWRGSRGLADPDLLLAGLAAEIEARAEPGREAEPIGLLTHHLVLDEPVWTFGERLLVLLAAHKAVALDPIDRLAF